MASNPILDELYAIREQLWAEAGGDLQKFLAGVREREQVSGRLIVREAATDQDRQGEQPAAPSK